MKPTKSNKPIQTKADENHVEMRITYRPGCGSVNQYIWTENLLLNNCIETSENYAITQITSAEIEACDPTRLIHDLSPVAENPFFNAGPGKVIFSIASEEENLSKFLLKPEFRNFMKNAKDEGICWIYFAKPGSVWLRIILAASGSGSQIVVTGNQIIRITIVPTDIYVFFATQFRKYYALCRLAGITLDIANAHLKALIEPLFPTFEVVPHWFIHERKYDGLAKGSRP